MAPHDLRRPFKSPSISDQQKRRDISLLRQSQNRRDAQHQARCLASTLLYFPNNHNSEPVSDPQSSSPEPVPVPIPEHESYGEDSEQEHRAIDMDLRHASKLRGAEARRWFSKQLMLPEWMIDVPDRLNQDWYIFARPAGKRCFVVSSNGITVSRARNGSLLHHFPSALPNGAKTKDISRSAQSYCILDCIFHELDQTYYVIDMVCWAGISFYECTAEFRFFWLKNKLAETGATNAPSLYHKYTFRLVQVNNCDHEGLSTAYTGAVPYVKDGLLFYNKYAHYQTGNTPLAVIWKDENCSQYVIDTDSKGQVPHQQQVVLELQDDGKLTTSDDLPIVFGCLNGEFIQKEGLHSGYLLRFTVRGGGLSFVDGKLEKADLQYLGKSNRARAFADSYSKIMFQCMARHGPLRIEHLLSSITLSNEEENGTCDVEMAG